MIAEEWVRQVSMCQTFGKWSDEHTAIQARQALRGKVLKWSPCKEMGKDPRLKSCALLQKDIEARFDPGRTEAETQAVSKECHQKEGAGPGLL